MKLKFIHFRSKNSDGTVSNRGGTTMAYETDDTGYVLRGAASLCHPNDNFCRALGRVKAAGRINSKKFVVEFPGDVHEKEFVQKMRTVGWEMLHDLPRIESSQSSLGSGDC